MEFPPGPRTPPLLQAALVTASPYGWMLKRWERYGDVFSSRFPISRVGHVDDAAEDSHRGRACRRSRSR